MDLAEKKEYGRRMFKWIILNPDEWNIVCGFRGCSKEKAEIIMKSLQKVELYELAVVMQERIEKGITYIDLHKI